MGNKNITENSGSNKRADIQMYKQNMKPCCHNAFQSKGGKSKSEITNTYQIWMAGTNFTY